jgi:hypothetical protein
MSRFGPTREWLPSLLKELGPGRIYLDPDIPPKKLANAKQSCGIPSEISVIGLADTTAFGSAKDCIVFGEIGIWYHNLIGPVGSCSYAELATMQWEQAKAGDIHSSTGLTISAGALSKRKVLELFRRLGDYAQANAPSTIEEKPPSKELDAGSASFPEEKRLDLLGVDSPLREEAILEVLRSALPRRDLYVIPDIPADKMKNARQCCALPSDEKVLGLLDATAKGSARNGLLFGLDGIYWNNDWTGKKPGPGSLAYAEMARRTFEQDGMFEIRLGANQSFCAACLHHLDSIIDLLYAVSLLFWKELDLLDTDRDQLRKTLCGVLANYADKPSVSLDPDIPPSKLENAKKACEVPQEETILALVDCTALGSAKDCLMFGNEGIYWHNPRSSKSPGRGAIPYGDLAHRQFEKPKYSYDIHLGDNLYINTASSQFSRDDLLSMLEETASLFSGEAPGAVCPSCGSHRIRIRRPGQSLLRSGLRGYLRAGMLVGAAPVVPALALLGVTSRKKRMKCCLDCGHHWPLV